MNEPPTPPTPAQGTAAGPQQREVSHHADQLRKDVLTLLDRACAEIFDRDKTIENLRVEKAHLFRQLTMANAEVSRLHDENLRVRRELDLAARPAPTTHVANAQPPTGEEAGPPKAIDNPRPESRAAQQVPSSSVVWTEVIRSRWPNMATLDRMFIRQVRQRLAPFWEKHGLPAPGEKRYCVEPHLFDELIKYGEIFAGDLLGAQSGQSGQRERPQVRPVARKGGNALLVTQNGSLVAPLRPGPVAKKGRFSPNSFLNYPASDSDEEGNESSSGDGDSRQSAPTSHLVPWCDLLRKRRPDLFESSRKRIQLIAYRFCKMKGLERLVQTEARKWAFGIPPHLCNPFLEFVEERCSQVLEVDDPFDFSDDELAELIRKLKPAATRAEEDDSNTSLSDQRTATPWTDLIRKVWPKYRTTNDPTGLPQVTAAFCSRNSIREVNLSATRKRCRAIPRELEEQYLLEVFEVLGDKLEKVFGKPLMSEDGRLWFQRL